MNFTIEKPPVMAIEFKDVIQIKDAFVLGIYVFLRMELEQGEHTLPTIIDRISKQFAISEAKVLKAFEIIIDDLGLINMLQNKN